MSDQATAPQGSEPADVKGKGKAVAEPGTEMSMGEEDDSSSEDEVNEEEQPEEDDEDNMEEIDTSNIIADGRRTRGKDIDFQKANAEAGDDLDDDEDDEDFHGHDDDDAMQD